MTDAEKLAIALDALLKIREMRVDPSVPDSLSYAYVLGYCQGKAQEALEQIGAIGPDGRHVENK
jgi:hypothetical protein